MDTVADPQEAGEANETQQTQLVRITPEAGTPAAAAIARVLDSLTSDHSRRSYKHAFKEFYRWREADGCGLAFDKGTIQRHAGWLAREGRRSHGKVEGLSAATVNVRLAALRGLAAEAADLRLISQEEASGIARVKGQKSAGVRTGNWLTLDEAEAFLAAPNVKTLIGIRDHALLAVLIGCGLRREEVSSGLTVESIQQREGRWVIVDIIGKGKRKRSVPMASWTKAAIDEWIQAAGITSGRVFLAMNNKGQLTGKGLAPQNILDAVSKYGRRIGKQNLAPHDLRRTFAKLARKGRSAIEQIKESLGHQSILTTERYLGVQQNLQDAPCDHLGIRGIRLPAAAGEDDSE